MQFRAGAAPGNMTYRALGRTGLRVSGLSLGAMNFEVRIGESRVEAVERLAELLSVALRGGINLLDTCESYHDSEELLGEALSLLFEAGFVRRADLVISTKLALGDWSAGVNHKGLSRKKLAQSMQGSLMRLGLSYVDVVLAHRRDHSTPIEETVRAMNQLIDRGLAYYWGTSEWPAGDIVEAIHIARDLRLVGPVVEQTKFNLFFRERVELELQPLVEKYGLGIMAFSPLAEGILAGRYTSADGPLPVDSRFEKIFSKSSGKVNLTSKFENQVETARRLTDVAGAELSASVAELTLAWALGKPLASTVLIGASSVAQLQQSLQATGLVPLAGELATRMESEAQDASLPLSWTVAHRKRELKKMFGWRGPHP